MKDKIKNKRLFIALKYIPDRKILNFLENYKNKLIDENIKWMNFYDLHLTLKFLGDSMESLIPDISNVLKNIAIDFESFNLNLTEVDTFYRGKFPAVLFLKMIHHKELIRLVTTIDEKMELLGFKKEKRQYKPHITFARIKNIKDVQRFNYIVEDDSKTDQTIEVSSFFLIESVLSSTGPKYKTLETYNFPN